MPEYGAKRGQSARFSLVLNLMTEVTVSPRDFSAVCVASDDTLACGYSMHRGGETLPNCLSGSDIAAKLRDDAESESQNFRDQYSCGRGLG